jgi:2-hydroxy-3-keto-5-methylthiopentenyl-1-phosphate phosphatase
MVKADHRNMLNTVMTSEHVRIRPGFKDLIDFCRNSGIRTIIVSNGLTFYIEALLDVLSIKGVEIHASKNEFSSDGMKVGYSGPDGKEIDDGFKEAYTSMLLDEGYEVIYIGDGSSDIVPARLASLVYATGNLLEKCREGKIDCISFDSFHDILNDMKSRMNR